MKKRASLPDTNFILRYLLRDNEEHFVEASVFFENVRVGKECAIISESVLIECLYVLTKHYKVPRADAARSLGGILIYKGIVNSDRELLSKALTAFAESTLDPVDCVLLQKSVLEGHTVRTFDKGLLKQL
ncbi:MAG: PIN domain-containing protein [Desulfuromonadales bacterium]|nr:PIN domain-containing protein [Desulfuromonadales bacterium]